MEYLLKVSVIVFLFYTVYKLLLEKETFFTANRYFLLSGIFIAFTIPLITIPVYTETATLPVATTPLRENIILKNNVEPSTFNYIRIISAIYITGLFLFSFKLFINVYSLIKLLTGSITKKVADDTFIETNKSHAPFSFFKWIVYNPSQFSAKELEHVLLHEKTHVKQYHSIDNLIAEIATIILWFNPIVWLYKNSIQQNLEYIADNKTSIQIKSTKFYQKLLLKTSIKSNSLVLTNTFYNSLIKKRIVMLQKNKSKKRNLLKLTLVIPFLALFLVSFNTKEVYIDKTLNQNKNEQIVITGIITDEIGEPLKGALVTTDNTGVKTNAAGKYAIKTSIGKKLTFSFMSLIPQEITVNNEKEINITLLSKTRLIINAYSKKPKYYYKGKEISKEKFQDIYFSMNKNDKTSVSKKNQNTNKELIISGLIKNENGKPINGVTILNGKIYGVKSNKNGKFSIKANKGDQLIISKKGMKPQKVIVGNYNNIDIILKE